MGKNDDSELKSVKLTNYEPIVRELRGMVIIPIIDSLKLAVLRFV